jgi:hypothetical protein
MRKLDVVTEDFLREHIEGIEKSKWFDPDDMGDVVDLFLDNYYNDYVIVGADIYEILEDKSLEDNDMYEATENADGSINFTLRYYNGACGFGEALEQALENIEEKD